LISPADKNYLDNYKKSFVYTCECKGEDVNHKCWKNFRLELKKAKANIPIKYRNSDFSKIKHPQVQGAKEKVIKYCSNIKIARDEGFGLYLWGSTGLAKTTFGCLVLTEALKHGYTAQYYASLSHCVDSVIQAWKEEEQASFNIDFILIDNIGTEYKPANRLAETTFDKVFRERSNNLLPIILTSNFSRKEIGSVYGGQLVSLFDEHLIDVEFKGADYRTNVMKKVLGG
jgi:DNA replication protein DnaC